MNQTKCCILVFLLLSQGHSKASSQDRSRSLMWHRINSWSCLESQSLEVLNTSISHSHYYNYRDWWLTLGDVKHGLIITIDIGLWPVYADSHPSCFCGHMGFTGRVWRIHSWSVIVANSLWRYSVYHQALQQHIYCFALLLCSLPVQCWGLMTEQGWCCRSSNHLVTQMVRLLTTHLCSSLIITSSAQGSWYQNMCLTLHSSRDTSRWRHRMQVLWRLWVLLGLKWQRSQVIWEVSPSNCVQQYSSKTTAYPCCAGLWWEPKDGTVWFVKVSSETENRQKIRKSGKNEEILC